MNLSKRLNAVRGYDNLETSPEPVAANQLTGTPAPIATPVPGSAAPFGAPAAGTTAPYGVPAGTTEARANAVESSDALSAVKERAATALYERLGNRISDSSVNEDELSAYVKDELRAVIEEDDIPLSPGSVSASSRRSWMTSWVTAPCSAFSTTLR